MLSFLTSLCLSVCLCLSCLSLSLHVCLCLPHSLRNPPFTATASGAPGLSCSRHRPWGRRRWRTAATMTTGCVSTMTTTTPTPTATAPGHMPAVLRRSPPSRVTWCRPYHHHPHRGVSRQDQGLPPDTGRGTGSAGEQRLADARHEPLPSCFVCVRCVWLCVCLAWWFLEPGRACGQNIPPAS